MEAVRRHRWSDSDRYWGPFTYAPDCHKNYSVVLTADVHEDTACNTCSLRISIGKRTLIIGLPPLFKPYTTRHVAESWDEATVERLGRNWYEVSDEVAYGFTLSDAGTVGGAKFLQVFRGRRTHDSATDRSWSCFLPWTEWRHVRHSLYDLEGKHFWSELDEETRAIAKLGLQARHERWEIRRAWEEMCPRRRFVIRDYDGAEIAVTTKIEEREWRWGKGWFTWLSWFKRPMIRRSLDLQFEREVGPEKGSYKGGLMGHSIEMLPGELHEAAMRRYCEQEHRARGARTYRITYVGEAT